MNGEAILNPRFRFSLEDRVQDSALASSSTLNNSTATYLASSSNQYLQNNGSGVMSWSTVALAGFNSVIVYTGASNWVKSARPAGITKVIVEVQGAGGGGSSQTGNQYCGGSAGGYAKKFIDVSSVTQAVISVGLGGAGAAINAGIGTDGGDSRWLDTAFGGSSDVKGVKGVSVLGAYNIAAGGIGSGGDINIPGGNGGPYASKTGGASQFGIGGWNGWTGENTPGVGGGYGSGGGGGYNIAAAAGAPGIVVVWEFK